VVYLIGGGPGSPDLVTLKGKKCIRRADIVIYDYLVSDSLLSLAGSEAELIYVGKQSGQHTMSQREINKLLIEKAGQGLRVARLKGGDPFIFGRGGEEGMALARAGIPFEVVPGITSAIAVPAYAGIPLTHRAYASTVSFITGHEDPTKETSTIDWGALAQSSGTLVFLMGIGNLPNIVQKLMDWGRPPECPVAVIANGTTPNQKTITGRLDGIVPKARKARLNPPGVIVVGNVAALREHLNWFELKPLFGKTILVTRPEEQGAEFMEALSDLGAQCLQLPTIRIQPPASWRELDQAIAHLPEYDWILFTSVNGVKYFFERIGVAEKDGRCLSGVRIGTIGPKTAQALTERGIRPDLLPSRYCAEGLVEELEKVALKGKGILIPRPRIARDYLPEKLKALGATVDVVEAYRTVQPDYSHEELGGFFGKGTVHMITFTSPSAVDNFVALVEERLPAMEIRKTPVACIGPITAQRAQVMGFTVAVVPSEYTADALARALVEFYSGVQS